MQLLLYLRQYLYYIELVDYLLSCIPVHFQQSHQSYLQVNYPRIYGVNCNSLYFRLD